MRFRFPLAIIACLWPAAASALGAHPTYTIVKPPGVYDVVLNGGADPTGVLDSSNAFQAGANSGKQVWVPIGTYDILTPPIWPSNSSMLCQGTNSTTPGAILSVDPANIAAGGGALLLVQGGSNITIDGCVFDGHKPTPNNKALRMVFIDGGDHVQFRNSIFRNSASIGLAMNHTFRPVTNSGVDNCIFDNLGVNWVGTNYGTLAATERGLAFAGQGLGTNNYATNNTFSNIGSSSLDLQSQTYFLIENNYFNLQMLGWRIPFTGGGALGFGIAAIYVHGTAVNGSSHITIRNNAVLGVTGNCIDLVVNFVSVTDNAIDACGGAGVSIGNIDPDPAENAADSTSYILVTRNIISNAGISLRSGDFAKGNIDHVGAVSISCGISPCPHPGHNDNITVRANAYFNNGYDFWMRKDGAMTAKQIRLIMETNGPEYTINAK